MTKARQEVRRGRRGFTLIELLVVIAIIALLIGLLVPALSAAKKSSQQIKCLSNTAEIGKADSIFANDHQEYYPGCSGTKPYWTPAFSGDFNSYNWSSIPAWTVQLGAYLNNNQKVFQCPAAAQFRPADGGPDPANPKANDYWLAVSGADLLTTAAGANICYAIRRDKIAFSTAYIMGGDCTYWRWDLDDLDVDDQGDPPRHCLSFAEDLPAITAAGYADFFYGLPHFGGVNVLYGDCHAAFAKAFDPSSMTYYPNALGQQ